VPESETPDARSAPASSDGAGHGRSHPPERRGVTDDRPRRTDKIMPEPEALALLARARLAPTAVYAIAPSRITGKSGALPPIAERWPARNATKSPGGAPPGGWPGR